MNFIAPPRSQVSSTPRHFIQPRIIASQRSTLGWADVPERLLEPRRLEGPLERLGFLAARVCRVPKLASCLQIADFSGWHRVFGTPQVRRAHGRAISA